MTDSFCSSYIFQAKFVTAIFTYSQEIDHYMCKNCEYKQHQCFYCGDLEPSDGPNAKVVCCIFHTRMWTCGWFVEFTGPFVAGEFFHWNIILYLPIASMLVAYFLLHHVRLKTFKSSFMISFILMYFELWATELCCHWYFSVPYPFVLIHEAIGLHK